MTAVSRTIVLARHFIALCPHPFTKSAVGTAPVIQINGDNPAFIHVGDNYADLGATITGPTADLNLGIKTFLNGTLVSNIVIDTSTVATDTIDYVATDTAGLTSTSTRTVHHRGCHICTDPLRHFDGTNSPTGAGNDDRDQYAPMTHDSIQSRWPRNRKSLQT